jgi:CHASE2 domain-containing sensor protein
VIPQTIWLFWAFLAADLGIYVTILQATAEHNPTGWSRVLVSLLQSSSYFLAAWLIAKGLKAK